MFIEYIKKGKTKNDVFLNFWFASIDQQILDTRQLHNYTDCNRHKTLLKLSN